MAKTPVKLYGSRSEVMHETAKMTRGRLKKKDLKYNKHGRIVSKRKSMRAKKEKRLEKAGYYTQKGVFGSQFREDKKVKQLKGKSKKSKSKSKSRRR